MQPIDPQGPPLGGGVPPGQTPPPQGAPWALGVPLASRELSTGLKALIVMMGACCPGGLLFLLALITSGNVNFDKPVWFLLAIAGGGAGYALQRRLRLAP